MRYLQGYNRLADSRKLDAHRKRLIRKTNRRLILESVAKANSNDKEILDKISLELALRFSNGI